VESSVELRADSEPSIAAPDFLNLSAIEAQVGDDAEPPLSDRPHENAYPRPDAPVLPESAYVLAADEGHKDASEQDPKLQSASRFPAIKSASKHASTSFSRLFEDIVGVPIDGPLADQDSIWALAPGARGRLARQALQHKREIEVERGKQAKEAAQNRLKMHKTLGPVKPKVASPQPSPLNATLQPSKGVGVWGCDAVPETSGVCV
jgi:hypothetical protein